MKIHNLVYFITLLILSCSSSDETNDSTPESNFELQSFTLVTQSVTTTSASLKLEYTYSGIISSVSEFYNYRVHGSNNDFVKVSSGQISNLDKGTKYEVYGEINVNGNLYESERTSFIIKGFNPGNASYFGELLEMNKSYRFTMSNGDAGLDEAAQPLLAYLKIGNDSIAVQSINVQDDITATIEIEESLIQDFFAETNDDYSALKAFKLGIFSKDYYVEIDTYNSKVFEGVESSPWSVFNKKPFIQSVDLVDTQQCINFNSGREGVLQVSGGFWIKNPTEVNDAYNSWDNFNLTVTNIDNQDISYTYFPSDILTSGNVFQNCDSISLDFLRGLYEGIGFEGFHSANVLNVRFDPNLLPTGSYEVECVFEKDNQQYFSNKFNIEIQ